jgi:hypothetical protein
MMVQLFGGVTSIELVGSTPEHFTSYLRSEIARWTLIIRKSGVKVE